MPHPTPLSPAAAQEGRANVYIRPTADGPPTFLGSVDARRIVALSKHTGADVRDTLAAWVAVELLGARTGDDVARVLGLKRRTAYAVLAELRRATGQLPPVHGPPTDVPPAAQDVQPLAPLARGEGGALPSASLVDRHSETQRAARASGAPGFDEEGSAAGGPPPFVREACAHRLRGLGLAELDVRRCMAWVVERWTLIEKKADPRSYAVSVALNRATELGLRPRSGREALAALARAQGTCRGCGRLLVPGDPCGCP